MSQLEKQVEEITEKFLKNEIVYVFYLTQSGWVKKIKKEIEQLQPRLCITELKATDMTPLKYPSSHVAVMSYSDFIERFSTITSFRKTNKNKCLVMMDESKSKLKSKVKALEIELKVEINQLTFDFKKGKPK